ncbi:FAD-binding protein [Phycicoccus sp. CSK15P-2]|uniref:D-arabinono-1,4-lactone oxidase n=1 Tax=Phycicoccus sp. CSK15P-2 TaxID=2807627 RepID=UPI0019503906|nr:D-arabinono-1,4-lactone oxidase [Phycicoccus sp. CSK15P-2]MBM6402664.1 FAD-binding protein [Phycicoccus sp. CSK15P-2]
MRPGRTWAGSHTFGAERLARPRSVAEVQDLLATTERVRALGSRHSFTDIADTAGTLVSLDDLPREVLVDETARTVSVSAGTTYGQLAATLEEKGWALGAMASLPHIAVAGAVSTGTHGSGDGSRTLSAAVATLDVVGPDGTLRTLRRGEPDFAGSVVGLGALGVVTRLELDVEPSYLVSQTAYTGLTWTTLEEHFDDVTALGHSVSVFTSFDERELRQLWVKARADAPPVEAVIGTLPATRTLHMLDGAPEDAVTPQGGVPGPWLDRLPHFRTDVTPSRGAELQSEYLVPRDRALEALAGLRRTADAFRDLLQVCEIRTVAADDLWLSGAYGRDTVGLHFTWDLAIDEVREALAPMEEVLLPLGGRPHWGKVFRAGAAELAPLYPRFADFRTLRDRVDPDRRFGNGFLERTLGD